MALNSAAKPGPSATGGHGLHTLDRADAAALALLAASVLAMFWRVVFTSDMFFYRDVFNYTYPVARFIHEVCRRGHLPYWNPYLNYGEPVLANPNFLFFYPYTVLIVLLPASFAYSMHYVVHFALAATGTYLVARRWGQSPVAAFFAGFVFVFSGPVLSLGNFYNEVACAAWIPWALLLTDRAVTGRSRRPWILLTLVFALQFLSGEPFTLLASFGLSVAYAFWRVGDIRHPSASPNRCLAARLLLVGLLSVALCAVQVFPSLDLLRNSRRGTAGLPFNETASWSFHPLALLEMVMPNFLGSVEAPTLWTLVLSCRNTPYFPSLFVGFVPLFFALAGWVLGQDRRRHFVGLATLAFLLLSLGRFTPFFALAYLLVPPLELVRFPIKLLVPVLLLTALLAGWGLDALQHFDGQAGHANRSDHRHRILLAFQYLLALAVLVWMASLFAPGWLAAPATWILLRTNQMFRRGPSSDLSAAQVTEACQYFLTMLKWHLPGLAGFITSALGCLLALRQRRGWARKVVLAMALVGMVQLVGVNYSANPTVPSSFYTYRPPVLSYLQDSTQPYRFCFMFGEESAPAPLPDTRQFLNFDSIPEAAVLSPLAQVAFRDRLLLARGSMLTGVEASHNTDLDGSLSPYFYDFWIFAGSPRLDPARRDCLVGRSNVKYLIHSARQPSVAIRELAQVFNGSSQPSHLYQDLCFTPRAYFAGSASYSASPTETLARLSEPDFDVQKQVILTVDEKAGMPGKGGRVQSAPNARNNSDGPGNSGAAHAPPLPAASTVEMVDQVPGAVTLRAELSQSGYVVLLDSFDPNWHATVDGQKAAMLRANHMFRAVRAEAGHHVVGFYYRQRGLQAGMFLSLSTLALLTIVYLVDPQTQ